MNKDIDAYSKPVGGQDNPEPSQVSMDVISVSTTPDPFDPASLRISPTSNIELGVKKLITYVRVGKPNRQDFFRTHPDPDFRMVAAVVELKEERETYVVTPQVANAFPGEIKYVEIRVGITRTGVIWLWPVPLPAIDGRENAWNSTARDAAERSESRWIRLIANMGAGCYDVLEAPAGISDPVWPDLLLHDLLRIAFGTGRLISAVDHPVLKRLLGT